MFFKNNKIVDDNDDLVKVTALLIHAAKIDEIYSRKEEEIIKQALLKIGANTTNIDKIISDAKLIEENTNQILDFTKKVKNMDENDKIKIVETLWRIIYSDKKADMYETNLMRRLVKLLYVSDKSVGYIKNKIEKENS